MIKMAPVCIMTNVECVEYQILGYRRGQGGGGESHPQSGHRVGRTGGVVEEPYACDWCLTKCNSA
jgi:hypothetical protein